MKRFLNVLFVLAGITVFVISYIPNGLLIDMKGHPKGRINKIRAVWGADNFWREQIQFVNNKIKDLEDQPRRHAEMEKLRWQMKQEEKQIVRQSEVQQLKMLKNSPISDEALLLMLPTREEKLANQLRAQADELEHKAGLFKAELWRRSELKRYYALLAIIENKGS